jgi:hypothetical protein
MDQLFYNLGRLTPTVLFVAVVILIISKIARKKK